MSEAELYMLRQRLNAGRLSKVQRGMCNVCPPAWCASRIPASSKIPIARSNMLSSSSWPRLKNWAHATGSYGTASSRTSAFRGAMSVGARTETSSGVSPRNRPFAPSSPTRLCRGLRPRRRTAIPRVNDLDDGPPRWCAARWPSGTVSSTMPTQPISVGHNIWPIRPACRKMPSATQSKGVWGQAPREGRRSSKDSRRAASAAIACA